MSFAQTNGNSYKRGRQHPRPLPSPFLSRAEPLHRATVATRPTTAIAIAELDVISWLGSDPAPFRGVEVTAPLPEVLPGELVEVEPFPMVAGT